MTAPADAKLHNKRRHSGKTRRVTHDHPSLKDYQPFASARWAGWDMRGEAPLTVRPAG
jgi:hypothetical protein